MKEVETRRAESFLRIQRRDVFETVFQHPDYVMCGPGESSLFRKRIALPREKKRTAETTGELVAIHLEDTNKGYPRDFTNYQTYDKRRNDNYDKDDTKFRRR